MAVWQLVNDPGTWDPSGDPVPEGVRRVALHVAAELYKAGSAPGGEYQLDAYTTVPAVITSNVVRKYGAVLAPWARVTGMVG
jgi:transglutaminase-like putative cysteine protease